MEKKNYDSLSLEQLEAERASLAAQRAALGHEADAVAQAIERKVVLAKVQQNTGLSEAGMNTLRQVLQARGIKSEEKVGVPGANA